MVAKLLVLSKPTVLNGGHTFLRERSQETPPFIIVLAAIAGSACLLSPLLSNLHGRSGLHAILVGLLFLRAPLPHAPAAFPRLYVTLKDIQKNGGL